MLMLAYPSLGSAEDRAIQAKPDQAKIKPSINSAVKYLFSKQAKDGGWHSEHYGALRSGAATTSLALYALSFCASEELTGHRDDLLRAAKFLAPHVLKNGYVSNADGADYATYSSAMLLIADARLDLKLDPKIKMILCKYLVDAQLGKKHDYDATHIDFGGWDLMGWARSPRPTAGSNISVSCLALEALTVCSGKVESVVACKSRAMEWLDKCRGSDGGYFFHPRRNHLGNKAGSQKQDDKVTPNSYGTATCDGLRCLLLTADPTNQQKQKIAATISWIEKRAVIKIVPGFEDENNKLGWGLGLRYYYIQSLSQILSSLEEGKRNVLMNQIAVQLISEQSEAGSWQNPNARMREDDPLIATSFCLIALAEVLKGLK